MLGVGVVGAGGGDEVGGAAAEAGEGDVDVLDIGALPQKRGDSFAARAGFDPRALDTSYRWFRIHPRRIQAWREVDELAERELMRDGRWLV